MNKTFFTSDLHFCHNKPFLYEPRGFSSIEEMNEQIIKNINKVVDWEDDLYILGDCFLNDNKKGMEYMRRLPGRKHIIWGNHCTDTRQELMKQEFDCLGFGARFKYKGYHFYLSHYPTITTNFDKNKPLRTQAINLCGHSHTKDKFQDMDKGLIFHVELDTNNCYPWLIDDLIAEIQQYTGQK